MDGRFVRARAEHLEAGSHQLSGHVGAEFLRPQQVVQCLQCRLLQGVSGGLSQLEKVLLSVEVEQDRNGQSV